MAKTDPRVDKRRVTMTGVSTIVTSDGITTLETKLVDYVRPDFLDAYLVDAGKRWDLVEVSEEPDAGPAGYDGATYVPAHLDHPAAHTFYPATDCKNCDHAPEFQGTKAKVVR